MAGRPRLSSPERRRRILASKARWRDANREYYRAQRNLLTNRPEYKARRKELRELARVTAAHEHSESSSNESTDVSTLRWYQRHVQGADMEDPS